MPREFDEPDEIDDLERGAPRWRANAPAGPPRAGALEHDTRLLASLRDDDFEATLFKQARDEAALGRLSPPVAVDGTIDLATIVVAQRFGVAQGLKADGAPKGRAISPCQCRASAICGREGTLCRRLHQGRCKRCDKAGGQITP